MTLIIEPGHAAKNYWHHLWQYRELMYTLDWRDYVESDPTLPRPTDLRAGQANPSKTQEWLGWTASSRMWDVVRLGGEAESPLSGV